MSSDSLLAYERIESIEVLKRHLSGSRPRFYEVLRAERAPCLEERLDIEAAAGFGRTEAP